MQKKTNIVQKPLPHGWHILLVVMVLSAAFGCKSTYHDSLDDISFDLPAYSGATSSLLTAMSSSPSSDASWKSEFAVFDAIPQSTEAANQAKDTADQANEADGKSTADSTPLSKDAAGGPEHKDLGKVGSKLANPLSNLWAVQMNFETLKFYDGDLNLDDPKLGSDMIFQPVLPIPLQGTGEDEWRMITRPIIPVIFSTPVPRGYNDFYNKGGIGDIQLPLVFSLPDRISGKWVLGAGPVGMFPTATSDELGNDQWGLGPAVAVGYKAKDWTAVLFPNYFWKVGSSNQDSSKPDLSQGSLLYAFTYNLPDAWQVGTGPTITYNDKASGGNKWNVPVGLFIGKTIKVGSVPVNLKTYLEYSVVSPDDFGKRMIVLKFSITPVIPGLIKNPIFGE